MIVNDQTGGWAVRKNTIAQAQLEQYQGTVAFPASAPKPEFSATQPDIPNNLAKVVANLNHGTPDQYGLYTAFAGKPKKVGTTPFNSKIKGDGKTQYQQPAPNAKGDDLMPADDGTPLRPSIALKKMSEAAKSLAEDPSNADRRSELLRMYYDILRIFHISERRPLNSDEIARNEEYARVIDRMLLEGPPQVRPDDPPDILNQDQLDQLGDPAEVDNQFVDMFRSQQQREIDNFDRERQRLIDDSKHDDPPETSSDSLNVSRSESPSLRSSFVSRSSSLTLPLISSFGSISSRVTLPLISSFGSSESSFGSTSMFENLREPSVLENFREPQNIMSGESYTVRERKEPRYNLRDEHKEDTPILASDTQLSFEALKLISDRFDLRKKKKYDILDALKDQPKSTASKVLKALRYAALNPPSSSSSPNLTSKQKQEEWRSIYVTTINDLRHEDVS